jgi:metal-dependent amidase/aminoacylase/carboxypeptidase family protein
MPPDRRREVMQSDAARDYVNRLRPEDRSRLVKETLDRGIRDQLERYKKMSKEERKEFVEKAKKRQEEARKKMDELPPEKKEQVRKMATSKDVGEMMEQASKAYLSLTTSDERAELQPLYDGALDNLQHAQELK